MDHPIVRRSRLAELAVKRVNATLVRRVRIRRLTSPEIFDSAFFTANSTRTSWRTRFSVAVTERLLAERERLAR